MSTSISKQDFKQVLKDPDYLLRKRANELRKHAESIGAVSSFLSKTESKRTKPGRYWIHIEVLPFENLGLIMDIEEKANELGLHIIKRDDHITTGLASTNTDRDLQYWYVFLV